MKIDRSTQSLHLVGVSRSFALTIPMLPEPLQDYISNAYLLCRIADTIEDDPIAPIKKKVMWLNSFSNFALSEFCDEFELLTLHHQALELVKGAVDAEKKLVTDMVSVIERTQSFPVVVKQILGRGVSIMSNGMAKSLNGITIKSRDDVDRYCYFVAGVVGELLAALFSEHNHQIDREKLMALSVSFGEGLQLTNILKDRNVDASRNVSFLPSSDKFEDVLTEYLTLCQGHLDDALDFICEIPRKEYGIRRFCLVNILMASATLQKLYSIKEDNLVEESIKIKRKQVVNILFLSKMCTRYNWTSRLLFKFISRGLPRMRRSVSELYEKVSLWNKDDIALM